MRLFIALYVLVLFLFPLISHAKRLILPVEAIESSRWLNAKAFKMLYPGIDIEGTLPDEIGWYIQYEHEKLSYFFGPLRQEKDANTFKRDLEKIHQDVVAKRPSLANGIIKLYHCSYSDLDKVSVSKNHL